MEKCKGLTQDEDNMIRQCFIDPVITELRSCGTYSTSPIRSERRTWRPSNRKRIPTALDLEEGTRQYTKKAIEMLSMLRLRTDTSVSFKLVDLQRETSGRIKHEKLKTGSFIQAVVHKSWTSANNSGTNNGAVLLSPEESCIIERAEDNFACSFWYVICFLETKGRTGFELLFSCLWCRSSYPISTRRFRQCISGSDSRAMLCLAYNFGDQTGFFNSYVSYGRSDRR